MEEMDPYMGHNYLPYHVPVQPVTPPGLEAIYKECRRLYLDQPNPLQVTAVLKIWLGGPDPLDYISMYANPGDPATGMPPHWHYISFGLSDLHGDERVHKIKGMPEGPSGFGFELTFRLKRKEGEMAPPTWPATLMQALARYVFQSENKLCAGDHVSWHSPLDGSESRIQHMLLATDPQLRPVMSAFGTVNFAQIVGVCAEELRAAQQWNGPGIIELLKDIPVAGGPWLITDMRRGETIFEKDPSLQDHVDRGMELEGSSLSGVSGRCSWEEPSEADMASLTHPATRDRNMNVYNDEDKENQQQLRAGERRNSNDLDLRPRISEYESEEIKATLKKGLIHTVPVLPPIKSEPSNLDAYQGTCKKSISRKESFDSTVSSEAPSELLRRRTLDRVQLKFNPESGSLLLLALNSALAIKIPTLLGLLCILDNYTLRLQVRGRLKHGRHFTFKSVLNDVAITLVPSNVTGAIADEESPYATYGPWLQVLLMEDFIDEMLLDLEELSFADELTVPKTYSWPQRNFSIVILPDEV